LWRSEDGFEGTPQDRWSCWHTVDNGVNRCTFSEGIPPGYPASPRSGTASATLRDNVGWSDVGRTVTLSPFLAGRTLSCAATIYGKHTSGSGVHLNAQLEVIDVASWTYVAIAPLTLTGADSGVWRQITTTAWTPPHRDVFVRIGLIGDNDGTWDILGVDDMAVQCVY